MLRHDWVERFDFLQLHCDNRWACGGQSETASQLGHAPRARELEESERVAVALRNDALTHASAQILAFVSRRLLAERVAIVCAARTGVGNNFLPGLPELVVHGLGDTDALALLLESLHGPLDAAAGPGGKR